MSLLKSSIVVSFFTLCSRILGFARDICIALFLGSSAAAEAFFVAFRLPNMFRAIFAEGAFHVVFVPLISKELTNNGQKEAEIFAGKTFTLLMLLITAITIVAEIFMPYLIKGLAPGFTGEQFDLTVALARITFPYLVFITFVSFCGSILNSLKFFAAAAAAPTLLNLSFIFALIFSPYINLLTAEVISYAVPIAGLSQALLMFFALKKAGFRLRFNNNLNHPSLSLLFKRMGPALLGVGAQQVNVLIDTLLASTLATGAISYLYYADRLNQLPLGLIGIAVGTALLPHLSAAISKQDNQASQNAFLGAFRGSFAIGLSASFALVALAEPLMQILFVRGEFTAEAATQSAKALQMVALGLPAYILLKVTTSVYYASGDTKTPVRFGLLSVAVNIVLNFALIDAMAHAGLALASAIAAWVNLIAQLLIIFAKDYLKGLKFKTLLSQNLKAIASGLSVAPVILIALYIGMPQTSLNQFIWLGFTMAVSGICFILSIQLLGVLNVKNLLRRRKA